VKESCVYICRNEKQEGQQGGGRSQFNQMCSADDLFRVLKPLQTPTLLCWRSHRKDNLAIWEKRGRPARSLVSQLLYAELQPMTVPRSGRCELTKMVSQKEVKEIKKMHSSSPDSPTASYGLEFTLDG